MTSLRGHFLIASSQLEDPNFAQTVILMIQHDEKGALGLVINRATEVSVAQACSESLDGVPCVVDDTLYQGGPCQGPLMVVHTHEHFGEIEVMPGLYFSTERDKLEWLLKNAEERIRFFVGYSGWAADQLEAEIEIGSWLDIPADIEVVLGDVDNLWEQLMTKLTLGKYVDPKHMPDDPSVN